MDLTGWGRYPRISARGFTFEQPAPLGDYLRGPQDCIVHGLGRSYGDSALNERVILSRRFDKILTFDPEQGLVSCESGVSLAAVMAAFLPRGWFLAVTPGTKFVTVGGAIASDVHGKNHHKAGCFSQCLLGLTLMLPDGRVVTCSREEHRDLFLATCGGMGLTGVILTATFRLQPVKSASIRETIIRSQNLEEIFNLFRENQAVTYSVAWIDCLAQGDRLGRSVLMLGEHADSGHLKPPPAKTFSLPLDLPGGLLNRYSVSWFNHFYYQKSPRFVEGRLAPLEAFFFPLDKIAHWNRLYGRQGFTQYQLVLPQAASFAGLTQILKMIGAAGLGSFLGVLKLFGPENDNYLSFPLAGYTLALDFKIQDRLFPLLSELDRVVVDHGGRLYLAKDVRMSQEVFQKGYPRWEQFAELRARYGLQTKFNSLQSRRLGV